MRRKIVISASKKNSDTDIPKKKYIKAAEGDEEGDDFAEDDFNFDEEGEEGEGLLDALDDVADNLEDLQDSVDDMEEDDVDIMINNNIADHYIAECEKCGGVFISAVIQSDQKIDYVSGVCPLCGRETEQKLKWVIKDANE